MSMSTNAVRKIISSSVVFVQLGYLFLMMMTSSQPVFAGSTFQTAYVTLGNSRFSFIGAVSGSVADGSSTLTIKSSGNPDNDMGNLFPEDVICFNGGGPTGVGCKNSMMSAASFGNYVATNSPSVSGQVIFFTPAMSGTVNDNDRVVSTQSGQLTISFKPTTTLVSGDKIVVTIPAASTATTWNDGIPDSAGFDSAALPADLIAGTCSGTSCFNPTGFTASAVALSSATTLHTVTITLSSALDTATVYSFVLGHASNTSLRFLNPAPSGTSHVRGVSDSLSIEIKSQNSAGTLTYDDTIMKVNPIDGVFISANVEEALTYKINEASQGHTNGSSVIPASTAITECNGGTFTTTSASSPTAVSFGSITQYDTFYRAAQEIYVQTNSANGYVVTAQYNNALKTAGGVNTIADGNCDGGCSATVNAAWGTASNNGFGYTLGNYTGTDATWTGATFKLFSSTPQQIMAKSSSTNGSRVNVCYQLSVDSTQATGFYFNKLTYVATPKF